MTYDEIIAALHARNCSATSHSLERAVEEEKRALFENASKYKLRDGGRAALAAAKDFYAEDITRQLNEPVPPTPARMLDLRRFPVVWAVAEVLRTNKLCAKCGRHIEEPRLSADETERCDNCKDPG
jgi:hypothetical protein